MAVEVRSVAVQIVSRMESILRITHTYVVLEISPEAHAEIKTKLLDAGYDHFIDGETIDMHGIALEPDGPAKCQKSPIREHFTAGVLIDKYGNVSGDPEAVADFQRYARSRPTLLNDYVEPNQAMIVDEQAFTRP